MLKKILLVIVVLVAVFLIVAALQPNTYRVERSISIAASASAVFAKVNDLHEWEAWSPWEKLDPNMKSSFSGPASGVGAAHRWSGDDKVGEGTMTIVESRPNELVRLRLDFEKPFKDSATGELTFRTEGGQTKVTWAMYGKKKFIFKAVCLFMSMDKMIGGDFERGLAQLKAVSEARK